MPEPKGCAHQCLLCLGWRLPSLSPKFDAKVQQMFQMLDKDDGTLREASSMCDNLGHPGRRLYSLLICCLTLRTWHSRPKAAIQGSVELTPVLVKSSSHARRRDNLDRGGARVLQVSGQNGSGARQGNVCTRRREWERGARPGRVEGLLEASNSSANTFIT